MAEPTPPAHSFVKAGSGFHVLATSTAGASDRTEDRVPMHVYTLIYRHMVQRPRGEVFQFFSRPENLARITPPSMGFQILTPSPVPMEKGTLIDYTIGIFGFRLRWRTLITTYEPPFRFVDEQLQGPYSFWHHTHTFTDTEGGTLITDEIRYVLPYGFLGRLAHGAFVRRHLESIFAYRENSLKETFAPRITGGIP